MYPGIHARSTPEKPAVVMAGSGRVLTYAELDHDSAKLARVLHDAGLRRGDVVALLSDNAAECFEVYWAAMRSGLYITAINRHLAADEVGYIVNDSGAKALVVSAALKEIAEAIVPLTNAAELKLAFGGEVAGYGDYRNALENAGPALGDQPRGAEMLYSSGTTGRPKGVRLPLPDRQVDEPGDFLVPLFQKMYGLGPDDVYLSPAPIYHTAPLRWCGVFHSLGATVVVMEKFDPEQALAVIERHGVTATQMVPTMFVRMLKLPEEIRNRYDIGSLKVAVHAAAPCPVDVKRKMIDWWGPIIHEYYGSTEGNGITFIDTPQWLERPGSVGRSALGPVHICDDNDRELPPGKVGLIYFERDELPFVYHNDPGKTRAAQHPDHPNWTAIGDVGYVDDDGYVFLTDRKSFMIISGGVNIYPQEIEAVLTLHPKVFDVAVIGIPDPEMGEQVKAVVQPAAGAAAGADLERELIEYVRARIAHYKAPRSVDFVGQLPRTPTGKLLKHAIRQPYLNGASATV
ncbi:acyl-CoA synthetase [Amycolatopsis echigonensis]|uniref:Acyl-CoA synthetase n=1 Tax=Amycolatopsis echigonensis TaxID=2576905 RepID=A0A8E1W9Y9_9PSEU|nr:acyl-CoA synthetase [Amycolatopsis echigonensis]MBB2506248.1 acyl-CoA synthetase [Amycolatopsis echigonensis]